MPEGLKVEGLTLDSGALIAAEKRDRRFMAFWKDALARKATVTVPAVVLGQVLRGNHAVIFKMLRACVVEPFDEETAGRVGALLAKSRTSDVVDGAVVIGATDRGDSIITSDGDDIERLVVASGRSVPVYVL